MATRKEYEEHVCDMECSSCPIMLHCCADDLNIEIQFDDEVE